MSLIDLTAEVYLETAMLLKWEVPSQADTLLTDYTSDLVYNTETYQAIGTLLSISKTTGQLKAGPSQLSITLSGVPTNAISDIMDYEIKGSDVTLTRHTSTDGYIQVYKGIVTNYRISDAVNILAQTASSTITLTCNSVVEILSKKSNGRRTNKTDFPGEESMDRVQALANSNYNFGAPQE